jgi:succinate dehydrogenase / fumarate reductase cytochrome b subunit|tara:strand:+ start:709 stop:1092 length:384 start_codon:yes stop_codon:yes gene_type:complete
MNQRPVYIDLRKIKLPMSAFSSITHRLSGMYIFFISLPLFIYLLFVSTKNKTSFDLIYTSLQSISVFSVFVFISFSILWYHILTGVRHLVMDFFHIGETLKGAYYSSIFVLVLWVLTTIGLFGYFYL